MSRIPYPDTILEQEGATMTHHVIKRTLNDRTQVFFSILADNPQHAADKFVATYRPIRDDEKFDIISRRHKSTRLERSHVHTFTFMPRAQYEARMVLEDGESESMGTMTDDLM